MAPLRVEALILRNLRLGDTSRIVTVLSRELGKWSGVAKGGRDPKGRFGASLEIMSISTLVVYFRAGRDLQTISEGSLEREFRGLLSTSERYHHGCAVLEFLDRVLEEGSPVPEVYDLSVRVLALMEEVPEGRPSYLLRAFQLRTAGWLGYAPRLERCVICGAQEVCHFGMAEGGLLCRDCGGRCSGAIPLGAGTMQLLRSLCAGSLPRNPSRDACRELERVAEGFLSYHLERYRGLRSLRALSEVGRLRQRPTATR